MPTEDTDAVPPFNRQEHESERKAVFDAIDRFLTRYYGCRCPEGGPRHAERHPVGVGPLPENKRIETMTDYENIPSIEMTQWRVGRVLSERDVEMIGKLLRELDDELNRAVDAFSKGREQLLRELGGQEFVDLDNERMDIDFKLAWKRACIKVAEKKAELDRLQQ